jgi:hypothetical protein
LTALAAAIQATDITQWVALLVLVASVWRVTRGGGGTAVSELSTANRVLEKRNHELGAEVRDLRIEVAELRTRTDFAAVIAQHEARAQQRNVAILAVLDLIAARLGPDAGPPASQARAA